ncbi:hypothetical protein GHT06_012366 [Daphnia sinensis]|uniref:Uncharacterized protein n=1 Tax=Daphnia sinensis TaxID=1820382 RepID=A0AAD5KVJ2_9CRUS|nr:hypothetical protein GHT06_012366 [Daphnia sinensis]
MIICETKQVRQLLAQQLLFCGVPVQAYSYLFFNPPRICALLHQLWSLSSIRMRAFICTPDQQAAISMFYTDKHQRQRAS